MLCVHVTLEVLEVGVLLVADVTDAELLRGHAADLTNHTLVTVVLLRGDAADLTNHTLVTVVLLQPGKVLVADIARVRPFTCTVGQITSFIQKLKNISLT